MKLSFLRRTQRCARRDLRWFLVAVVAAHVAFIAHIDLQRPDLYDPEYGARLKLLQRRVQEHPERPVLLALGSSRIGSGLVPEALPELKDAAGRTVLPFNLSHLAGGPRWNRLTLDRSLREGVRPSWVLLEFAPLALGDEGAGLFSNACAGDLPILLRHGPGHRVAGIYARSRLNPFFKHRQGVLRELAPCWLTSVSRSDAVVLGPLGGDAGWTQEASVSAEERRRRTEVTHRNDAHRFLRWTPTPKSDRALRETLELCGAHDIRVALLLMPLSAEHLSWIHPEFDVKMRAYLDELRQTYGVHIIDAQGWLPAEEHYADSHHLLKEGAERFTRRLAEEALPAWLGAAP